MHFNKDIITRLIFSFIFFAVTLRVLGPLFFSFFKKKMPGSYQHDNDIDSMIRRQKERLRSQYGLSGDVSAMNGQNRHENFEDVTTPPTKEVQKIYQETQWGGGSFVKDIQQEIAKTYSYTMADSKVNAFILLCEKRNYLRFLSADHRASDVALKNYMVTLLLLFLTVEELREKKLFIIEKMARKLSVPPDELALAFQIKLLMTVSSKKELKDERIYAENLVISQYSEETIKESAETIAKREANLWAKSPSQLFEELTLALNYAGMLAPMPKLKNKKDVETAYEILGASPDLSLEEVKKLYKKLALQKHPDKIVSQKLPKVLERRAFERFNKIQEAYEVITSAKK